MIFSNACLIVASMAMIPTAFSQGPQQGEPGSTIGGVVLKTDVRDELLKDLIFKKLTDEIKSESCDALDDGKAIYEDNAYSWLSSMPTYTTTKGTELKLYEKYYGKEFLKKWVDAAFSRESNSKSKVTIGQWGADFSKFNGEGADDGKKCVGREEAIKKVIGYTSTYIELNQYMQEAVELVKDDCIWSEQLYTGTDVPKAVNQNPCKDAVNAWEKAIAIWSGSIEGRYGRNLSEPGETGKFLQALAEKRCVNYGTCGTAPQFKDRTKDDVTPRANMGITASFEKGRAAIFYGQVGVAKRMISQINKDLTISRIQGVMRYAYRMGRPENKSKKDKEIAEGAAFALGALPQIYACNKSSAAIIAQNMQIGGEYTTQTNGKFVNFANVRAALECNYPCLGIRFSDIGSLNDCEEDGTDDKTLCFGAKKDKGNICKSPFSKKFKKKCKTIAPSNNKNKLFVKTRFGSVSTKQF